MPTIRYPIGGHCIADTARTAAGSDLELWQRIRELDGCRNMAGLRAERAETALAGLIEAAQAYIEQLSRGMVTPVCESAKHGVGDANCAAWCQAAHAFDAELSRARRVLRVSGRTT